MNEKDLKPRTKAFAIGGARQMKKMALDDPDLQPLWEKIKETRAPA